MGLLDTFYSTRTLMPHGYSWQSTLVGLHAISDGLICLAYLIIPITLLYLIRHRKELPMDWRLVCFSLLIIPCGITHGLEVITLWYPYYWISGMVKALTALISITIAILLIRLVASALNRPSHAMSKTANDEIQHLNQHLEKCIQERTAELVAANRKLQQEISERKKVEQSLRHSEASFRLLTENLPQIIWTVNAQGETDYCNQRWADYTGLAQQDLLQARGWQSIHPEDIEQTQAAWNYCIATGESLEIEYRIKHISGNYHWHLGRALPLKDASGKILKWFGTSTDIENQKRIVNELYQEIRERRRAEQSLRDSEERFRMLAETSPQIVWTIDPQGKIDYCNQQWLNYTGLSWEDIQRHKGWQIVHPDDLAQSQSALEHSLKTGELFEVEYRLRRTDGVYRWHLGRAIPLKNASGIILKWFGTTTDIDDQKRAAAKLQSLHTILEQRVAERTTALQKANLALQITMAELERSNQELAQFAYVASHDLQEPLRMVSSYTQLLERRYKDKLDADANQFIHFAVDGAKRMQQLITALLTYSKVTTQQQPFQPVSCDSLLQQVLINLKIAIEEANVKISYSPLPTVLGEPTKLLQLFQNLLTNAIKFRCANNPEIDIQATKQEDSWLFQIKDNGIGIESEYFEKIFVIFQRLHGKHSYPGTGIGLAICKRIVELHGGNIWITSEVGKGTVFHFTIPTTTQ